MLVHDIIMRRHMLHQPKVFAVVCKVEFLKALLHVVAQVHGQSLGGVLLVDPRLHKVFLDQAILIQLITATEQHMERQHLMTIQHISPKRSLLLAKFVLDLLRHIREAIAGIKHETHRLKIGGQMHLE